MSDLADYRHSRSTRRLLRSLVPIACPPECEELGVVDATIDEVELSIRSMPPLVRLALVSGMRTYDLGAIARYGRRAGKLDRDRALAYFKFWRGGLGLQRQFAKGIKSLIVMAYYELPPVLERLGYAAHRWVDEVSKKRLELYADDIAKHEATIFEPDPVPLPSEVEQRTEGSVQLSEKKGAS